MAAQVLGNVTPACRTDLEQVFQDQRFDHDDADAGLL